MKDSEYWAAGAGVVAVALLAWFAGGWLRLWGGDLWVFRGGLAAMGIAGIGAYFWSRRQRALQPDAGGGAKDTPTTAAGPPTEEIDSLIAEAESNLGRKLVTAPIILLVGPSRSGKTSVVTHAGLEAQLLAGQIQDGNPDAGAGHSNLWVSQGTILLEAASWLLSEPKSWARLIRRLTPGKLSYLLKKIALPARAALVCVDCGDFLSRKQADSMGNLAKNLRMRLKEICQITGASLPVYVLFTKADRLEFFAEYARNLDDGKSSLPLGVTLGMGRDPIGGGWAEHQTRRLTEGLDEVFYSLSGERLDLLSSEHDQNNRRAAYQFPREFVKLRHQGLIVQFLVDVCRPYQLGSSPFLRGYYFAGTRQRVTQPLPTDDPALKPKPHGELYPSATRIAAGAELSKQLFPTTTSTPPSAQMAPEWVFLTKLFSEVIIRDLAISVSSSKVNYWRRVALGIAALLFTSFGIGSSVSYFGNRQLESEMLNASHAVASINLSPPASISNDGLHAIEYLRQSLALLSRYEREGAPWRLRWGLYSGHDLYPEVRRTYFDGFGRFILSQTQAALHDGLRSLPQTPGAGEGFNPTYEALKAYLITTSKPEKSTRDFLSPVLLKWWERGQALDPERRRLALLQFDFYSEEQRLNSPYPLRPEDDAVEHGRGYLQQFSGVDRVYQMMLTEASKQNAAINFNRQFPGSEESVVDTYVVPGSFTKAAWISMQDQFKKAGRLFPSENWVVVVPEANRTRLAQELPDRYQREFVNHWRLFLEGARIVPCRNSRDAARKLALLSGSQSPLLGLFCTVSQHVAVGSPQVAATFQPLQTVVPPDCQNRYVGETNNDYINSLFGLQQALNELSNNPTQADLQTQATSRMSVARSAVHQVETKFHIDQESQINKTVAKLLYEPVSSAERCGLAGAEASGVCGQFRVLKSKYPFNPAAATEATPKEIDAFFNPNNGTLWTFRDQDLAGIVRLQGNRHVSAGSRPVRTEFLRFLDSAKELSDALYKSGQSRPQLRYSVKAYLDESLKSVTLTIDGQTFTYAGRRDESKGFVWPATDSTSPNSSATSLIHGAELTAELVGGVQTPVRRYKSVFQLFGDMIWGKQSGSEQALEWIIRERQSDEPFRFKGNPVMLRFGLTVEGPPIFRQGYLSGLDCVSRVVQ